MANTKYFIGIVVKSFNFLDLRFKIEFLDLRSVRQIAYFAFKDKDENLYSKFSFNVVPKSRNPFSILNIHFNFGLMLKCRRWSIILLSIFLSFTIPIIRLYSFQNVFKGNFILSTNECQAIKEIVNSRNYSLHIGNQS